MKIVEALGARATVSVHWHGEELDRLLDAAHAGMVDAVVRLLRSRGWDVAPEVTLSVYGERGSIDVLALHSATGALLVIEVKSAVPDMQGMLSTLDRKGAPRAQDREGAGMGRQHRLAPSCSPG